MSADLLRLIRAFRERPGKANPVLFCQMKLADKRGQIMVCHNRMPCAEHFEDAAGGGERKA